ncbi:MAG: hydroxymethylglutaryl-CoA lyase [Flavobacteriaceae bacterium]
MQQIELIECPRDAMQGIKQWIPTAQKIRYAQSLLKVGFDVLDIGSFVSPKAIPQMRDTAEVLASLDRSVSHTDLLTIVANERGAATACSHPEVDWLGYPFSISENFQMRNTHKTIADSERLLERIVNRCAQNNKGLVVYLSMGFGNPYGDPWSADIVAAWLGKLSAMGVEVVSLSDTVGAASPAIIGELFSVIIPAFPSLQIGAHLHVNPADALQKIDRAYQQGCRRFDGAIRGYGGCPMAKDELIGNMPTEKLLTYCSTHKIEHSIHPLHFESAYNQALDTFP